MRESDELRDLRRTRGRATDRYAWRLRAGDLLHTPSDVFLVLAVANGAREETTFQHKTTRVLVEGHDPCVLRRTLWFSPYKEVRCFRPGG